MKSLIIDTSNNISYIILIKDNTLMAVKKILNNSSLSKYLMPSLEEMLKNTNTTFSELQYIATSIGPGSYTGIRVGASICKTISYVKNIPLIGYISLKAYIPDENTNFLSIMDAKSSKIFLLEGKKTNDEIIFNNEPKLVSLEDLKKYLEKTPVIVSPDTKFLEDKLDDLSKIKILQKEINFKNLISYINKLFQNKNYENSNRFKLLYLKGPNHLKSNVSFS